MEMVHFTRLEELRLERSISMEHGLGIELRDPYDSDGVRSTTSKNVQPRIGCFLFGLIVRLID